MDEKKLTEQLKRDGFKHTYVWQDGPNAFYPEHTHETGTAHIVLDGAMTLTMDGESRTFSVASAAMFPREQCTPRAWGRKAAAI
jgi:hypothetical protein